MKTKDPESYYAVYCQMTHDPEVVPGIYFWRQRILKSYQAIYFLKEEDSEIRPDIYLMMLECLQIIFYNILTM